MLQCLILAGGLGTRMRPQTELIPKALIPVRGKPFAFWQLEWLASQEVERVVYSVGHLGHMVEEYVGNGAAWGIDVRYVSEGPELLGTGGAIRLALNKGATDEEFFVLYGDSYLTLDLSDVEAAFRESGLPALMTVYRNDGMWDRSNVIYRDHRIVLYQKSAEPPPDMHHIDYGLSILSAEIVREYVPANRPSDIAPVYSQLSSQGRLAAYEAQRRFYEVGSPEGLADLELALGNPGNDFTR